MIEKEENRLFCEQRHYGSRSDDNKATHTGFHMSNMGILREEGSDHLRSSEEESGDEGARKEALLSFPEWKWKWKSVCSGQSEWRRGGLATYTPAGYAAETVITSFDG